MHTCPQHHQSETPDFCSVCGAEIPPGSGDADPAGARCPDCGTPRESAAQVFCEACGHNYRTGAAGDPLTAPVPRSPAPPPSPGQAPGRAAAPAEGVSVRWDVVVRVDGALHGKPNPDAPVDQPPQTFTLFDTENMIGREGTGVRLQVPVRNDPGVSRRQALLLRQPDGGLVLRDLNSVNGTQLNGIDLVPGVDTPVRDGDTIAVGAWTRIAVRAVLS
jgi:hypothetical protein